MNHVHWPLVVLSVVIGFGLTIALMVRPIKVEEPAQSSTGKSGMKAARPTVKKATAGEPRTTKIPVAAELSAPQAPVGHGVSTARVLRESPTTQISVEQESPTTKILTATYAPYGPGSARAGADGSGPPGWQVKGRTDSRLYYIPDDPTYDPTVAQVWFQDEASAMRAFFVPWRKSSRKT